MRSVHYCVLVMAIVLGDKATAGDAETTPTSDQGTVVARRVPWTNSRLEGTPDPPPKYIAERVFAGLQFEHPAEMQAIPGTNRMAVIEVKGKIWSFPNEPLAGEVERDLFADVSTLDPKFHRVYGLTFHPQFATNRYCFISYVLEPDTPDGSRVSRFEVTRSDPPRVKLDTEQILITWVAGGHNGAHLQFGPDGFLYISTGDGGSSFPPDGRNTGQDVSDLLASILRIVVYRTTPAEPERGAAALPYAIPADNPFVGRDGARHEIWAYGLRNPWKMCFDPADGSLWVADVGWEMWEMVYRIEPGGNYGWSLVEGRQPVHTERRRGPTPILPPTVEHSHTESRSITGGYFVGSDRLKELQGAYVYGDYVTGVVWALRHDGGAITWRETLVDTPLQIVTFGRSSEGDLYLVDYGGTIHRLIENPRRSANHNFPRKLSDTGLFASIRDLRPSPGVVSYDVSAEPWADGTVAERHVALPGDSQLGVYDSTDVQVGYIKGDWKFPPNGVLAKTISIALDPKRPEVRRCLETQILHFDVDTWRAYNYVWNAEQTDAVLAEDVSSTTTLEILDPTMPEGKRRQTWLHASRTECLVCHTSRAGTVHGFKPPMLVHDEAPGDETPAPLENLAREGLFAVAPPQAVAAWHDPYDGSADLGARARAYLHVNCGHCHRRGGGGSAAFDVQYEHPLEKTNLLGQRPTQGTFGIHAAEVVAAGDPYRSVLYYRMAKLGHGRMPHFGSNVVDTRGLALIRDWIRSMPADPESFPSSVAELRTREASALAAVLAEDPRSDAERRKGLEELLASPSGALRLVEAIDDGRLEGDARTAVVNEGIAHADARIRDLFERYIPEEQRPKRLGTVVDAAALLALPGDAARGRRLFLETEGVQCRNCHRVGKAGKEVGPDLSQIGRKLDRAKLLESLLEPSRTIDPKYVTHVVETTEGRVYAGLLIRRDDAQVVLRDNTGKDTTFATGDIEQITPQQVSLMPELLLKDLTPEQVADLLEFLAQAK